MTGGRVHVWPIRDRRHQAADRLPGGSRQDDPDLTVREFAEWLSYSASFVRRAIRNGELAAITLKGPQGKPSYRLELAACIAFLRTRSYNPARIAILEALARRRGALK